MQTQMHTQQGWLSTKKNPPPQYPTPRSPTTAQEREHKPQQWPNFYCFPVPDPCEQQSFSIGGRFRIIRPLGTGAYGIVYLAMDMVTGHYCAVKSLNRTMPDGTPLDCRGQDFQTREIRTHWLAQSHPNVVSMHGIVEEPDCVYVVLDYYPEGDLFHNITNSTRYVGQDRLVKDVFLQLLDAVEYCHSRGIYHRDLKPENILVSNQGRRVHLADFGLATEHQTSNDYGCGSTFYMSPECLAPTSSSYYHCAANDVWSLGVILVNLTCGRNPWKQASDNDATYCAFRRDPDFLKTILPITDDLNNILKKIFERDPAQRITIPQLVEEIAQCPQLTRSDVLLDDDLESPVSEDSDSDSDGSYSPPDPSSRVASPDLSPFSDEYTSWVHVVSPTEVWDYVSDDEKFDVDSVMSSRSQPCDQYGTSPMTPPRTPDDVQTMDCQILCHDDMPPMASHGQLQPTDFQPPWLSPPSVSWSENPQAP